MALTNQLYHTSIKIGEDAQTQIDFETANEIHFDADNAERVKIDSTGLNIVSGSLETATIDYTDGDLAITIADGGGVTFAQTVNLSASTDLQFNSTAILSDSAGTMTLSNIDAVDATTQATVKAAIPVTQYTLAIGGASSLIGSLADGLGTSGQVLTSGGAGAEPTWTTISAGISMGKAIAASIVFGG